MPDTGYTRSPKLARAALVQLVEDIIGPTPNVVPFQFNSDTMSRTITPTVPADIDPSGQGQVDPTAQPVEPKEVITLTVEFDAVDQLEEGDPVAAEFGVTDRVAAIEKFLRPSKGLLGDLVGAAAALVGAPQPPARPSVPIAFLVWGKTRIVPVRVTDYSIEEMSFLPNLAPLNVKINLTLQVLTPDDFRCAKGPIVELAIAAFRLHRLQQDALAVAHTARNASKALSLLPF
jgi:hypothetical protein